MTMDSGGFVTTPNLHNSKIKQVSRNQNGKVCKNVYKKYLNSVNFKSQQKAVLKGQCHKIFCFWFFSWISFSQPPEYTIRAVSIFFENLRRYSQLQVEHRCQRHRWQICHRCQRHRRRNCARYQRHRRQNFHRYQRHRRQILPPVSLVLFIPATNLPLVSTRPAANLPLVSTRPAANCHRYQQHWRQICHWCQRHRWQTMGLISGCRCLKANLKAKMYIYVNSTIQRCPNKIIKIFLIEDFFHLPLVSTTLVVNLKLWISLRIFEKIWNSSNGILWGWGYGGWSWIVSAYVGFRIVGDRTKEVCWTYSVPLLWLLSDYYFSTQLLHYSVVQKACVHYVA